MELNYIEKWLPEASVKYKDGSQAVNLGLIITVFFKDGHLPEVRQKMVGCVDRYYAEFKPYLKKTLTPKWVGITEKNHQKKRQAILDLSPEEIFSWYLGSEATDYHAPEYEILIMGKRIFRNDTDRSVIKLVFPFSLLKESDGRERYQAWLMWLCNTFCVESGYAGLSFILPYEFHRMFPYEYKLAQRFPGVMVDSIGTLDGRVVVNNLKSVCWYTILGNSWVNKLGGAEKLAHRLKNNPEIELLPYDGGLILKAGALPPGLGETQTEDLPPLLVKVNQIIKPVRFNGSRSLHFYSEHENFQFDKESTMKWYRRFDEASAALDKEDEGKSWEPVRITCWSGEKSQFDGRCATIVNGATQYAQTSAEEIMPEFEDKYGQKHQARLSLLARDDGGSVFAVTLGEGD
ncbi:Uncharacterized protein conserved in bacteria [Cedecea lapagei]|uniref:Uncharacterized protein conserved in bacteria n=1 Tax=Cedecea lapagei TaxID=158823 RepID=A0A447V2U7_9ENTR|nr:DUF3396 domain-containing protein [Cedecea lapagei]VEB98076.1 Uncharacterized protein conserved in bacteria [Cedecea lapagei]